MLSKVTYTDNETIITASNLNNIQDSIIALENEEALPSYSSADNGKFLRISNGNVVWATVSNAEGASF